jgi:pimeloyl-ACP methyl ester carboxylesterase
VKALVVVGGTCITLNRLKFWEALALRSSPLLFALWPYGSLKRTFARTSSIKPEVQAELLRGMDQVPKQNFSPIWSGTIACLHYEPGYRIELPLLLTHGAFDNTGNIKKTAPVWARRDPLARLEIIPDAGHVANMDNPGYFNPLLMAFLKEHHQRIPGHNG